MGDDYRPLDLLQHSNAGIDVLGEKARVLVGQQNLRGLPFLIGDGSGQTEKCFILFDGLAGKVEIPVGERVTSVIFAHCLLDFDAPFGAPGAKVADYVFHLAQGESHTAEIRERFEIAAVPTPWFASPYRALPDTLDSLLPRYEGRWEETGARQTEMRLGRPRAYVLHAWLNPEPDRVLKSIVLVPAGKRFIVAGITLGLGEEPPFVRSARREALVIIKDADQADQPFNLEVEVDRGVATYTHPLPSSAPEDFLGNPIKGWGEERNTKSSPAYVEIAALPSASVTVRHGDQELGSLRWGEVEEKGHAESDRLRIELLDRGRNWVHVKVVDDETGRPIPCRIHFRSPEGIPYQPHGHHQQVNSNLSSWHIDVGGDVRLGQITYAYIDGTCQGWLPRGDLIVDVARGFEYEPLRSRVTIEPGQRELTLRLKRWIRMKDKGWFSGDSHVHFLSTQGAHFESQCEDLNVVNMLQSQWGSLFTNTEEFTGRPSVMKEADNIVYFGQENRQHFLGHLTLWGLKRPVMPWCSDGPDEAELGGTLEVMLSHWADECHAQGGTVIIPHFPGPNGEPSVLVATGRADAVEMLAWASPMHAEYYRYLNCGYRLPLVGGTDKMDNDVPVGLYRTYAHLPDGMEFNYENWCSSVAAGRTFLSGGPLIGLSVEGKNIGDTIEMPGPGTIEVEAWAESIFPIHTLQIVQRGEVVASVDNEKGTRRLELKAALKVDGHSWIAARCGGPGYEPVLHHDGWGRGIFAHTSPVYVAVGGDWWMYDGEVAQYLLTLTEGNLTYVRETAPIQRPGGVTHHHGEEDHLAYLERPLLEAREAIMKRMEQHR